MRKFSILRVLFLYEGQNFLCMPRTAGSIQKLVGTSLYGGHIFLLLGWNRVKVAVNR